MELTPDFEFTVNEEYENEKGIFTVLSIQKNEMVIKWKNGEKMTTGMDLQRRIQKRREREKIMKAAEENDKKSTPRKGL